MARVLLVDDDAQMLDVLARLMTRAGHEVTVVTDGAEALRKTLEHEFDIVVTDLIMPGKEGLETIRELHRRQPGLPVIAMSGGGRSAPADYLEAARLFGAARTLSKPFPSEELLNAIAALVPPAA